VLGIGVARDRVLLGGTLSSVNVEERHGLAAIDGPTGRLLAWTPRAVGTNALALSGDRLVVGGNFEKIDGEPRGGLAAFDVETRALDDWSPRIGRHIYGVTVLAASGDRVYAGGDYFGAAPGPDAQYEPRVGVAAFDAESGEVLGWDPALDDDDGDVHVHAIAISSDTIYLGGEFEEARDLPRVGTAAVDTDEGTASDWDPAPEDLGFVYAAVVAGETVYLGGWFSAVGGNNRRGLAQVDTASGGATHLDAHIGSSDVQDIAVFGRRVAIVGDFTTVAESPRAGIAILDGATGLLLPWNPRPADRPRYQPDVVTTGGGALIFDGYVQGNGDQLVIQPLGRG
jgi:hypothetical protein